MGEWGGGKTVTFLEPHGYYIFSKRAVNEGWSGGMIMEDDPRRQKTGRRCCNLCSRTEDDGQQ